MTDDNIKKYFLGELSEAEANGFEENYAQNSVLTEQAKMIENEIIDAYLRNELSSSERILFENNYLTTQVRREKLEFSKNFLNNFKEPKNIAAFKSSDSIWQTIFKYRRSASFAFAGILILLLCSGLILIWLTSQKDPEIAKQQSTNQALIQPDQNTQLYLDTNVVNQNSNVGSNSTNITSQNSVNTKKVTPTLEIKISPTPKNVENFVSIVSFILLPGTLRSEVEKSIKISPDTNKVSLDLHLPKDAIKYQTYNITLKTADGDLILNSSNLKSPELTLPAKKLENRTYMIILEGQNANTPAESITEYTFRVRR